jgi:hypothetical protein
VLEGARELVVEALNEGYDASRDAEDLAGLDVRQLLVVLPLLGVLDDDDLAALLEDLEELAELLVGAMRLLVQNTCRWSGILTASTGPGACGWRCQRSSRNASR